MLHPRGVGAAEGGEWWGCGAAGKALNWGGGGGDDGVVRGVRGRDQWERKMEDSKDLRKQSKEMLLGVWKGMGGSHASKNRS